MKKIDKKTADAYFRTRTTLIVIYLLIGFCVSYGVVLFAEPLSSITFLNMPLHYYMGAQGAVLTFIFLLFVNAIVSDFVDRKFGLLDLDKEEEDESGKAVNK
ncbi:DUF4212 domain-containing protein [Salimicrobium jeotgali]|uniref:DUF4212 domain-containing protein n=1 Tax=Salimicrobium jeotgali TaxID=1230341 RepID=UPI000C81FB4B|nr:DUF4212 domain-containing protein [Salimicrobium jeotgali]